MRESGRPDNDLLDRLAADARLGGSAGPRWTPPSPTRWSSPGPPASRWRRWRRRVAAIAAAHPEAAAYSPGLVL